MNVSNTASGDRRGDDKTKGQSGYDVLGGVFRCAGNLRLPVDPGRRLAQIAGTQVGHIGSAHLTRLSVCDCGVPFAAWLKARTMARRASSILKSLWPKPRASLRTLAATCVNDSRRGGAPINCASARRSRHGL